MYISWKLLSTDYSLFMLRMPWYNNFCMLCRIIVQQLPLNLLWWPAWIQKYLQLHCCSHRFCHVNHSHILAHALFLPHGMLHALQLSRCCTNTIIVAMLRIYIYQYTVAYTAISVTAHIFFIQWFIWLSFKVYNELSLLCTPLVNYLLPSSDLLQNFVSFLLFYMQYALQNM